MLARPWSMSSMTQGDCGIGTRMSPAIETGTGRLDRVARRGSAASPVQPIHALKSNANLSCAVKGSILPCG